MSELLLKSIVSFQEWVENTNTFRKYEDYSNQNIKDEKFKARKNAIERYLKQATHQVDDMTNGILLKVWETLNLYPTPTNKEIMMNAKRAVIEWVDYFVYTNKIFVDADIEAPGNFNLSLRAQSDNADIEKKRQDVIRILARTGFLEQLKTYNAVKPQERMIHSERIDLVDSNTLKEMEKHYLKIKPASNNEMIQDLNFANTNSIKGVKNIFSSHNDNFSTNETISYIRGFNISVDSNNIDFINDEAPKSNRTYSSNKINELIANVDANVSQDQIDNTIAKLPQTNYISDAIGRLALFENEEYFNMFKQHLNIDDTYFVDVPQINLPTKPNNNQSDKWRVVAFPNPNIQNNIYKYVVSLEKDNTLIDFIIRISLRIIGDDLSHQNSIEFTNKLARVDNTFPTTFFLAKMITVKPVNDVSMTYVSSRDVLIEVNSFMDPKTMMYDPHKIEFKFNLADNMSILHSLIYIKENDVTLKQETQFD